MWKWAHATPRKPVTCFQWESKSAVLLSIPRRMITSSSGWVLTSQPSLQHSRTIQSLTLACKKLCKIPVSTGAQNSPSRFQQEVTNTRRAGLLGNDLILLRGKVERSIRSANAREGARWLLEQWVHPSLTRKSLTATFPAKCRPMSSSEGGSPSSFWTCSLRSSSCNPDLEQDTSWETRHILWWYRRAVEIMGRRGRDSEGREWECDLTQCPENAVNQHSWRLGPTKRIDDSLKENRKISPKDEVNNFRRQRSRTMFHTRRGSGELRERLLCADLKTGQAFIFRSQLIWKCKKKKNREMGC